MSVLLFREAMQTLVVLVVLNVAALGVAEWLWSRYLNSITLPFSDLLARTGNLDFTPDAHLEQSHAVLGLVTAWRENERERCKEIRSQVSGLDKNADHASASELKQIRAVLENLRARLPAHKNGAQNRAVQSPSTKPEKALFLPSVARTKPVHSFGVPPQRCAIHACEAP